MDITKNMLVILKKQPSSYFLAYSTRGFSTTKTVQTLHKNRPNVQISLLKTDPSHVKPIQCLYSKDANNIPESPGKRAHPLFHDEELPHFRQSLKSRKAKEAEKPTVKPSDGKSSAVSAPDTVHPDIEEAKGMMEGGYRLPHPIWSEDELESVKITHKPPVTFSDKAAFYTVKMMRGGFDLFSGYSLGKYRGTLYEKQWLKRIIFLETVAGVPGMVGAMVRHLKSLRLMKRDHGWIHTLLEEAENERMHLMTALRIANPGLLMKLSIAGAQGMFVSLFSLAYFISPNYCHRFVGYLEEEAVKTYTTCLEAIDSGHLKMWSRMKAPEIAIEYWKLSEDAMMRDVILAIRADEAHHRAVNHTLGSKKSDDTNPFGPGE